MKPSMKSAVVWSGCLALILAGGAALAAQARATPDFIQNASIGNQFEISSSRLALQNSQNENIRTFARKMIDDHTQMGDQLKSVLSVSEAKMAQPKPTLDDRHRAMLHKLRALSGAAFDKEYVAEQVGAHAEAAHLFGNYAQNGDNAELKNFANQNLPTIEEHLQHVEQLKSAI